MTSPLGTEEMAPPSPLWVLAEAAVEMHGQRDLPRLLGWAAEAARILTTAPAAALCFLPEGRAAWTAVGQPDLGTALGDPRRHALLLPAVQGDRAVRVDVADAHVSVRRALPGVRSLLAVPVLGSDAMPRGVAIVAAPEAGRFGHAAEEALLALAAHLAVALEHRATLAALDEARKTQGLVVTQLQHAVQPPTPTVPYTELGVRYEPAAEDEPTGGDLWDWILLPDNTLHFAVVDVMGKGVGATKDALAVTHALRLLVLDGCSLDTVVSRADGILLAQNPELVATVVVGRFNPVSGDVLLAGGGHPPPLLVRSGGKVEELDAPGIPIGFPDAGSSEVVKANLGRSDSLILYTDGLIEARRDILEGLHTLKRFAAETAPYPAGQQARVLVERVLSDAARRDDSMVAVIRRRTPPTEGRRHALGPFSHRLSPSAASVSVARGLLRAWLEAVPVDGEATEDLLLVATELCSNAVKHATWERGGVALRAWTEGGDVFLEVDDDGEGLELPYLEESPPDPEDERGRGLWLVQTFSDDVAVTVDGDRTCVRVCKRAVTSATD